MTDSNFPAAPGAVQAEPPAPPGRTAPDRNLALELARVTEAGAMAAARWVGRGDKNGADGAAVQAMRLMRSAPHSWDVISFPSAGHWRRLLFLLERALI